MITGRASAWRDRAARLRERYTAWEARRAARLSRWSVRRRYVALVVVPLVLCCCGGTLVGVPALWFVRETVAAGRGAIAPDAAASEYLLSLSYGQEDGLLPLLADEHQDELLKQWHAYRRAMQSTDPPASVLEYGGLTVHTLGQGRAEVSTDVAATWWARDGRATSYRSDQRTWRIEVREDDGWRVWAVHAPVWCGGYVRAERCRTQ